MVFKLMLVAFVPVLIAGTPVLQNGRIIGGVPVDIKNYPHQVSLDVDGKHNCGGAIVSETFVISAGHCINGYDGFNITVRVNTSLLEQGGSVHLVKNRYLHPDYSVFTIDYDISVVKLEVPLIFGDGIQPIGLPESGEELANRTILTISGWGATTEGNRTQSPQLMAVNVTSYPNEECQASYDPNLSPVTDRMICGNTPEGGHNSCNGDSGGPVTHGGKVYGLVSWAQGCAEKDYPTVYSRVANPSMRQFVKDITGL